MAFTCGFFNSQNGDRKYNAEQMASIFDGLIKDGVYDTVGDIFAVTPGTGMQVLVGSGRAWFDHTWNNNDAQYPLAITAADVSLPRYDAVVLETNHSDTVRTNRLRVLTGTPASNPVKPTMTSTANVKQHPLAYIKVTAGATAITQSMIQVVVGTSECPFVTGIIDTAQIDALFQQWNGEFNEWFENLKAQLSDNVVANLQGQIDQKVAKADVATTADIEAGTSTTKWVSPKGLREAGVNSSPKSLTTDDGKKIGIDHTVGIFSGDTENSIYAPSTIMASLNANGTVYIAAIVDSDNKVSVYTQTLDNLKNGQSYNLIYSYTYVNGIQNKNIVDTMISNITNQNCLVFCIRSDSSDYYHILNIVNHTNYRIGPYNFDEYELENYVVIRDKYNYYIFNSKSMNSPSITISNEDSLLLNETSIGVYNDKILTYNDSTRTISYMDVTGSGFTNKTVIQSGIRETPSVITYDDKYIYFEARKNTLLKFNKQTNSIENISTYNAASLLNSSPARYFLFNDANYGYMYVSADSAGNPAGMYMFNLNNPNLQLVSSGSSFGSVDTVYSNRILGLYDGSDIALIRISRNISNSYNAYMCINKKNPSLISYCCISNGTINELTLDSYVYVLLPYVRPSDIVIYGNATITQCPYRLISKDDKRLYSLTSKDILMIN